MSEISVAINFDVTKLDALTGNPVFQLLPRRIIYV